MRGCLRGVFRLVLLALLALVLLAAWWYRKPLLDAGRRWLGKRATLPSVVDPGVGAPTPSALASGQAKLHSLGAAGGPDSVILSANEMAALVGSSLDWQVRKSFDSLKVELHEGDIAVFARLDTRVIPTQSLGPLKGLLAPWEPIRIAGPITVARPGLARWKVNEFMLRGIPFPPPAVHSLARQAAGADTSGAVPLKVDTAIADVLVHPTGVVLYRSRRR
jgi:hypothetical protein